jgi:uncharacterized protein
VAYFLLEYDVVDDFITRRDEFRDAHLKLARRAAENGQLLAAGAVGAVGESADRAVLVWTVEDRAVIEQFVALDPYVSNGLVVGSRIRPWNVVVQADQMPPPDRLPESDPNIHEGA